MAKKPLRNEPRTPVAEIAFADTQVFPLERTGEGIELGKELDALVSSVAEDPLDTAREASDVRGQLIKRRVHDSESAEARYAEIVTTHCAQLGITFEDYKMARLLATLPDTELPTHLQASKRSIQARIIGEMDAQIKGIGAFRGFFPDAATHRADIYQISYRYAEARRRLDKRRNEGRDKLTGLINDQGFLSEMFELELELLSLLEEERAMVVARVDLDNFKYINDTFGHVVGDRILTEFATNLEGAFGRSFDIVGVTGEEQGVGGRPGGDEFCVLLNDVNMAAQVQTNPGDYAHFPADFMESRGVGNQVLFMLGNKIREAANKVVLPDGSRLSVTVGLVRIHQQDAVEMLYGTDPKYSKLGFKDYNKRADDAAVWAKEWGDGVITEWAPRMEPVPMTFERLFAKGVKRFHRDYPGVKIDDEIRSQLENMARILERKYAAIPPEERAK